MIRGGGSNSDVRPVSPATLVSLRMVEVEYLLYGGIGHQQHRTDTVSSPDEQCGPAHVFIIYWYNYRLKVGCGGGFSAVEHGYTEM